MTRSSKIRLLFWSLGVQAVVVAAPARGAFVTLGASADTYLSSSNTTTNYGSSTSLSVGNSSRSSGGFFSSTYILVRWDLSAYVGSTVTGDATFSVVNQAPVGPTYVRNVDAYRVSAAWDPTTVTYANFPASQTTGFGPSVDDTPISSMAISSSQAGQQFFTLGRALVQSWIDSPTANNGLFLAVREEAFFTFLSSEGGAAPQLSFQIAPSAVPEPASYLLWGAALATGACLRLRRRALVA